MRSDIEKHFAVSGFVMNRERTKLLMVFHKKLNIWVIPGGHLEDNEYPADGAIREIFEETGINATVINSSKFEFNGNEKESSIATPYVMLSEFIPKKGEKPAHVHMDFIFLCMADEESPKKRETEVVDVKWMTWEEVLKSDTFESIKEFARKRVGKNERTQIRNNTIL
ncbi:NUDIX domain-containing protein [Candidatus Saccharibacteria bacterium]|nr:NUDIX domain-containing protein [Candidatus Saccharibacteria bacterium]